MSLSTFSWLNGAPPTLQDIDNRIITLRDRIASIQDEIRHLEEYKSAHLIPISKLSSEVLSTIFELLALEPTRKVQAPPGYSQSPYRHWLPITQVCRLWRKVTLDTPRIWGCIYNSAPKRFAELLLERSKSAPLYLRAHTEQSRTKTVALALQHVERLKEIEIPDCTEEWVAQITAASIPLLTRVSLGPKGRFPPTWRFAPGNNPPIRQLILRRCVFDLNSTVFSNLHILSLDCSATKPPLNLPTTTEFLATLKKIPHLRSLELVNALSPQPIPSDLVVNLSFLTSLRIESSQISNLEMVKHITMPQVTSIKLGSDARISPDIMAPIAETAYALLPSHTLWKTNLSVALWSASSSATIEISVPLVPLSLSLSIKGTGDLKAELALRTLLPSTEPVVLSFQCHASDKSPTADIRKDFLRALTDVNELHVYFLDELVLVLSDTPENVKEDQVPPPFSLPSLRRILFQQRMEGGKQQLLSKLRRFLAARKAVNAAVEVLEIYGHGLSPSDMDSFSDVVAIQFHQTPKTIRS